MIRVTWEWLGQEPALDIANTITVESGAERDLWSLPGKYATWAATEVAAHNLDPDEAAALGASQGEMSDARAHIRDALRAKTRGDAIGPGTIGALNRASSLASEWLELEPTRNSLITRRSGTGSMRLHAFYARSALRILADAGSTLRVCPAPSCGMLFHQGRSDQLWCSRQCGTRARVTRHAMRARATTNVAG